MVVLQCGFVQQFVGEFQPGGRPERHANRDGPIEGDDRRGRELRERVVQSGDALPIRIFFVLRTSVTRGD